MVAAHVLARTLEIKSGTVVGKYSNRGTKSCHFPLGMYIGVKSVQDQVLFLFLS